MQEYPEETESLADSTNSISGVSLKYIAFILVSLIDFDLTPIDFTPNYFNSPRYLKNQTKSLNYKAIQKQFYSNCIYHR
jgi:hypothetical protein